MSSIMTRCRDKMRAVLDGLGYENAELRLEVETDELRLGSLCLSFEIWHQEGEFRPWKVQDILLACGAGGEPQRRFHGVNRYRTRQEAMRDFLRRYIYKREGAVKLGPNCYLVNPKTAGYVFFPRQDTVKLLGAGTGRAGDEQ
jgi:hypothetical protein